MFDNKEKSMKELLGEVVNANKKLQRGLGEKKIEEVWAEEMGPMIAGYTDNIYFNNGKVNVYLTSSTLRNELTNNRTKVIERLNEVCGDGFVTELNFR